METFTYQGVEFKLKNLTIAGERRKAVRYSDRLMFAIANAKVKLTDALEIGNAFMGIITDIIYSDCSNEENDYINQYRLFAMAFLDGDFEKIDFDKLKTPFEEMQFKTFLAGVIVSFFGLSAVSNRKSKKSATKSL